jgi:hypothetical protein
MDEALPGAPGRRTLVGALLDEGEVRFDPRRQGLLARQRTGWWWFEDQPRTGTALKQAEGR